MKRRDILPESTREAYEVGFAAGVEAEHARVLSVHRASLEGHEALTEVMMLDGRTTQGQAAMAVIAAERRIMADSASGRKLEAENSDAIIREKWRGDMALRRRFRNKFDGFKKYSKNTNLNLVLACPINSNSKG